MNVNPRLDNIRNEMNTWARAGIPFLYVIDFEQNKPLLFRLDEIDPHRLLYAVNRATNCASGPDNLQPVRLTSHPEPYEEYLRKFDRVTDEILSGNSYLLNLTCSTPIELNLSLKDVFLRSTAPYRLWLDGQFVCFSPECFVTIGDGTIRSFPMKGTIDASVPDAAAVIMNDPKETAEHYTIVDLLRNDLNMVSKRVRVERFRFIDTIVTHTGRLLQVSSEICGELEEGYRSRIGDIICTMLPAGSVSGAPKRKTVEIIAAAEARTRGYYTGVFGVFDGHVLDSGVMIRFIEEGPEGYIYRSGGGITSFSNPQAEYHEMTGKIYVPVV
jgi:para-aminobenzoate synthetase component I